MLSAKEHMLEMLPCGFNNGCTAAYECNSTVLAAAPYPGNNPAPQKRRSGVRVNWAFTERISTTSRVCSKTAQTAAKNID